MKKILLLSALFFSHSALAEVYEISGSAFATDGAPIPQYVASHHEKIIMVDPNAHAWGAYNAQGKLIRWGIATTGANWCRDIQQSCRTSSGSYRVYSLGSASCVSSKFPYPGGGAAMPYCMYFNGGAAIHGSDDVEFANASHGCVRVHVEDAKWLRYQFVEGPSVSNQYRGTKIVIKSYQTN